MPIFSRRATQKLVDKTSDSIERDPLTAIVKKLNRGDDQSLHALWEIIAINLLAKNGKVSYEISHGGRTKPDIYYDNSSDLRMVADITCVSDLFQNTANDVGFFNSELGSVAKKFGIADLSGFSIQVGEISHRDNKRITLNLPKRVDTRKFILAKLKAFLKEVARNRHASHCIKVNDEDAQLTVEYNPKSPYLSGGHRDFNVAKSLANNPIYNCLNGKRGQLKKSGYDGLKGVIICDGGCDLITTSLSALTSYSAESIIESFLREQDTVSFVITLFVSETPLDILSASFSKEFAIKWQAKSHCAEKIENLVKSIRLSFDELPRIVATPRNAANSLKSHGAFPGNSFYGGFSMNEKKVAISTRAILNLINGKLESGQFIKDHKEAGNFLKEKIDAGYKLKSISLKSIDDADDDWLEFEFESALDPAVTKFK